jgi:hypothetical protein
MAYNMEMNGIGVTIRYILRDILFGEKFGIVMKRQLPHM